MSYGVNHQVGVKASPDEIYKHLTKTANLLSGGQRTREVVVLKPGTRLNLVFRPSANNSMSRS
jgi:hypothetical protein